MEDLDLVPRYLQPGVGTQLGLSRESARVPSVHPCDSCTVVEEMTGACSECSPEHI